jgi:hypothetical protein
MTKSCVNQEEGKKMFFYAILVVLLLCKLQQVSSLDISKIRSEVDKAIFYNQVSPITRYAFCLRVCEEKFFDTDDFVDCGLLCNNLLEDRFSPVCLEKKKGFCN